MFGRILYTGLYGIETSYQIIVDKHKNNKQTRIFDYLIPLDKVVDHFDLKVRLVIKPLNILNKQLFGE